MKCCLHNDRCSGTVSLTICSRYVCRFHGELVDKLKTQSLADLEKLCQSFIKRPDMEAIREQARRVALCSNANEWASRSFKVFDGTYDYTQD